MPRLSLVNASWAERKDAAPAMAGAPPAQRLKIAFLVHDFPVISETFVINQAAALIERGHDLRIFALYGRGDGGDGMHAVVDRLGLRRRVSRSPYGPRFIRVQRTLQQSGRRWRKLAALPALANRSAALLSEAAMFSRHGRFDVVHCQFGSLGFQALRHAALGGLRYRKLVVHLRGYDISAYVRDKGRAVYAGLFDRADLLITNCQFFRQRAIELGCAPEKIIVIGSAIDCDHFSIKPRVARSGPATRLIAVGRLVEKKGFAYAIRAVARLIAAGRMVTLDIVGEGPLRDSLQAEIDRLGLSDSVRLLGACNHREIRERLRACDIMIASNARAASGDEDAPVNSLKEAMAVGLPVVATRHGGIPELVIDAENGYLAPERDPDALAQCVERLLGEQSRWPEMGRKGRARVAGEYDQPIVSERLIGAYLALLQPQESTP